MSLSKDMVKYWLAFAKSGGDPNANYTLSPDGPPRWPQFEEGEEAVMEFNTTRRVRTGGFQRELCAFWEGYRLARPSE